MPTKDELENQIYEKMSQENAAFLAEMKTKSPDEIISRAYEIACRDNLLMLFEDETSLSERQLAVLTEFEHPLSQLYTDWLSRDTDEMDAFRDSIACCADDILRKRVEEKYRDPAQPIYPNTRSEAMARGEVFEWMASRDRTLTCAGTFEKDATNAYNDGKLSAFLKEWTNTYGKDHCNDGPGRAASAAIQKKLSEYEVIDNPPRRGKDYNDQLQMVKGISGRVRTRGGEAR